MKQSNFNVAPRRVIVTAACLALFILFSGVSLQNVWAEEVNAYEVHNEELAIRVSITIYDRRKARTSGKRKVSFPH